MSATGTRDRYVSRCGCWGEAAGSRTPRSNESQRILGQATVKLGASVSKHTCAPSSRNLICKMHRLANRSHNTSVSWKRSLGIPVVPDISPLLHRGPVHDAAGAMLSNGGAAIVKNFKARDAITAFVKPLRSQYTASDGNQ